MGPKMGPNGAQIGSHSGLNWLQEDAWPMFGRKSARFWLLAGSWTNLGRILDENEAMCSRVRGLWGGLSENPKESEDHVAPQSVQHALSP